jgi:hypothetical protein
MSVGLGKKKEAGEEQGNTHMKPVEGHQQIHSTGQRAGGSVYTPIESDNAEPVTL